MRLINIIYILLPFLTYENEAKGIISKDDLFVCYGKIAPETIKGYNIVILESQHYNADEVAVIRNNNDKVVAYISTTEVNEAAFFYNDIKEYTLGVNSIWKSSFIDIQNPKAQDILHRAIEKIKSKGFNGIFLDNIDNVSKWGQLANQKNALITFIKEIKERDNSLYIIQNSGLFMSKELEKTTDAILIESVITEYNFIKKQYAFRDSDSKSILLQELKKIKNKPTYILEYAETHKMKASILDTLKILGYPSFISQINLQKKPQFK